MNYRDIYFGLAYFVGQETVTVKQRPVWSMSYAGGTLPRQAVQVAAELDDLVLRARRRQRPGFRVAAAGALVPARGIWRQPFAALAAALEIGRAHV